MPVLLLAVRVLMLMDLKGSTLGDAYIISKTTTSSLLEESFRKHSHQHNPKTLFEQTTQCVFLPQPHFSRRYSRWLRPLQWKEAVSTCPLRWQEFFNFLTDTTLPY